MRKKNYGAVLKKIHGDVLKKMWIDHTVDVITKISRNMSEKMY